MRLPGGWVGREQVVTANISVWYDEKFWIWIEVMIIQRVDVLNATELYTKKWFKWFTKKGIPPKERLLQLFKHCTCKSTMLQ